MPSNGADKTNVGPFHENDFSYKYLGDIGTGAGFYTGYIRVDKASQPGQVKTISFLISDGTHGNSASFDVNTSSPFSDITKITDSSSHAVLVTPDLVYLTGTWVSNSRLVTGKDSSNIPIAFKYTGTGTPKVFVYAQGDSNYQYIGITQTHFVKFST